MITDSNIKRGETVQSMTKPYKFFTYLGPSQLNKEYFIAEDDDTSVIRDDLRKVDYMPWDQES